MAPYVAEILSRTDHANADEHNATTPRAALERPDFDVTPSDTFHNANHVLRTIELERVPKGARHVLSVGANGRWYFEWFEACVGPVDRHVGVEAFEPKPDDLPPYVEWVANTADRMDDVADGTIDLVFAGQTTEHLWADELAGFLIEANRVLREGGLLVLDSPNRLVTEHLHWSHGGHTIELSCEEMEYLLELGGFVVESTRGVWSCVEEGRRLGLEDGIDDAGIFARRAATAGDRPDESFVWFMVARRTATAPDGVALRAAVEKLFELHWPTRLTRGLFPFPEATELPIPEGATGSVGRTLPYPMHAGVWTLALRLTEGDWARIGGFEARVLLPDGHALHVLSLAAASIVGDTASWTFDQPYLVFALSIELAVADVLDSCVLELPLDLRPSAPGA